MNDIVPALRSELQTLSAQVRGLESAVTAAQERLRKATDRAEKLKALLADYESEAPVESTVSQTELPINSKTETEPQADEAPDWKASTKNARMEQEVTSLLSLRGSVHRSNILNHLVAKGIMGGEKNPLAQLAAFLSNRREVFVPDGRGNFCLRPRGHNEPSPAPNGAGSAGRTVGDANVHP
jgi:hypothetical protein